MENSYQQRTCMGLQPCALHKSCTYLLSDIGKTVEKQEHAFQLWAMIIVFVALFLCFDEYCNLEYAHFEQELFTVTNKNLLILTANKPCCISKYSDNRAMSY